MKFITDRISTGKARSFNDFVEDYKNKHQIKTASVKTAEQDEADSSGQLDVEPLHQEGESTTMPKAGPSAKKDDGEKSAATTDPDAKGKDSGQPKAEWSGKGNGPGEGKGDGNGDGSGECVNKDDDKEVKVDDKEEKEAKVEEDDIEEKKAAAKTIFLKFANLDSKNRSFLVEYWRQEFGDDYVDAMVSEK